jgi:hypothetical protein
MTPTLTPVRSTATTQAEVENVSNIGQIEMARYNGELEDDRCHLVNQYRIIMGWEVPELDKKQAVRFCSRPRTTR